MQLFKLNKQFKRSNDWEKAGIAQLTDNIRSELSRLRKEQMRQVKKKREEQVKIC